MGAAATPSDRATSRDHLGSWGDLASHLGIGMALPRRRAFAPHHRQRALCNTERSDLLLPPRHDRLRNRHRAGDRRLERARGWTLARRQPIAVARLRSLSLLPRSVPQDHLFSNHDHVVRRWARIQGGDGRDLVLLSGRAQHRRRHARDRQGAHPRGEELSRQHLADGHQDLPSCHAPPGDQRRAPRPRRGADRHVAGRDKALQPRDWIFGDSSLQHLQHAADVRAADHPVRDRNRRQRADRPTRRPRRHQSVLSALLLPWRCQMVAVASAARSQPLRPNLPSQREPYYAGRRQKPKSARYVDTISPGTGEPLGKVIDGSAADAEAAIAAAKAAFRDWRRVPPLERAKMLRAIADVLRKNGDELAMLDAADCGNPYAEMMRDAGMGAAQLDFYAGLVTEMKGASIPMGPDVVNFSVREPFGVVGRIIPFNHPFMFAAGKSGAPLAAGNTVVLKPPEQAPLSALRLAELIDGILPPGVWNVVPGGREVGQVLASHPDVAMTALIGSVPTGRAVMKAASDTLKPVLLELGGKNALIAFPDADLDAVSAAVVDGMNFTWCGQSCGSTSRAFIHETSYDAVIGRAKASIRRYKPGSPTNPATTRGSIISQVQYDRIMKYIAAGKEDGARLVTGGKRPDDAALAKGLFIEPTIFADVNMGMRIGKEEIFGPVLSVFKWSDEDRMLAEVNQVEYGLTCSIWTNDLATAHRTAAAVEAGYVWINEVSKHFLGAPFGGYKQSGIGREECIEELLRFTREKNIHVNLKRRSGH